uniref:Immunoglobulin I-set domain-containing protein n=1 Tax=Romanomermis culicivorax TaxID=13658 RepID=A0A915HJR1_ROMCU
MERQIKPMNFHVRYNLSKYRLPSPPYSITSRKLIFRLRNGHELPDGARYKIEQSDLTYRLTIREAWDIDDGEYTCEISNPYGTDVCTARLTVQAPPVIEKEPENMVYPDGELVRLKIYFGGSPPFKCSLSLDKNEISSDHRAIKMVEFDDHVIITILSLSQMYTGKYTFQ